VAWLQDRKRYMDMVAEGETTVRTCLQQMGETRNLRCGNGVHQLLDFVNPVRG